MKCKSTSSSTWLAKRFDFSPSTPISNLEHGDLIYRLSVSKVLLKPFKSGWQSWSRKMVSLTM